MTLVNDWVAKIDKQLKFYEPYRSRGKSVVDYYRDEAARTVGNIDLTSSGSSYNLLYSITETLRPVLYNRTPQPEIRATDKANKPSRFAAEVLEDVLNNLCNNYDFDRVIKDAVQDFLLPATGVVRVVYDPIMKEEEQEDGKKKEEKVFEEVYTEYVAWDNLIIGEARKWEDVPWIAFRSLVSKEEAEELFGSENAERLSYTANYDVDGLDRNRNDEQKADGLAEIFEVWDKLKGKRLFISRGDQLLIEEEDDPLGLEGFFPIPRPLFANCTNNTLIPTPFFIYYQDLQAELEIITSRITHLIKEVKRRGFYNSQIANIEKLINAGDNQFVPLENYNNRMQNGGVDSIIHEMDISPIIPVIQTLYEQREQIRFAIFEIMGISDIQRGVIDPRETATASRMKGNFGSLRVSEMQREVQRFIRDIYKIKAEIISELFSEQSISLISGKPIEKIAEVIPLLRAQEPRMVRIDIETDSTIESNEEGEQQTALEFANVINQLASVSPVLAQTYGLDFTGELTKSIVRKFKMSRGLEDILDERLLQMKEQQKAAAEQEQQPDAEMIKAMNEQAKIQLEAQKFQTDAQLKVAELQLREQELLVKAKESQATIETQEFKNAIEIAKLELQKDALEIEARSPENEVVGV